MRDERKDWGWSGTWRQLKGQRKTREEKRDGNQTDTKATSKNRSDIAKKAADMMIVSDLDALDNGVAQERAPPPVSDSG